MSSEERQEMERVIALTENLNVPVNTGKQQAWDQLLSKIDTSDEKERVLVPETVSRRNWIGYAVAVAAVLFIGLYFFLPNQNVMLSTGFGDQQAFTLPDNSVVTLNANSSVKYNKKSWLENRTLTLTGEGYFEVQSGSDFVINTERGSVTVVGTSFNVYQRDEALEVSCFEGKVLVSNDADKGQLLEAGMQATIDKNSNRLDIGSFDPNQTATWRIGEFYFNEADLASVIDELERQFNITINVSVDIEYRTYSGYFNNQNLTEALQLVFTPMGLKYEAIDNQVTVQ